MDKHIQELLDKKNELSKELSKYRDAIDALRKVCNHDWKYDGHGHNYSCYTCTKCGLEEER